VLSWLCARKLFNKRSKTQKNPKIVQENIKNAKKPQNFLFMTKLNKRIDLSPGSILTVFYMGNQSIGEGLDEFEEII